MNWQKNQIDLGTIKERSMNKFYFTSTKELKVKEAKPSCGTCTMVGTYDNNLLPINYRPNPVPKHLILKNQRFYVSKNFVTVTYEDGSKEILTFTAKVVTT